MPGLMCSLHEWQELIGGLGGAFVGGVMGFVGAWFVARAAQKNEARKDQGAASVVVTDIVFVIAWIERIKKLQAEAGVTIKDPKYSENLCTRMFNSKKYEISPSFSTSVERLMGVSLTIPMHFKYFTSALQSIDKHLELVKRDREIGYTGPMGTGRTPGHTKVDEDNAARMSELMLQHGVAILSILIPEYKLGYMKHYFEHDFISEERRAELLQMGLRSDE